MGRVGPRHFEVWIRRRNYNSLAPRAFGEIIPAEHGSRVVVRIQPARTTRVGLPLLIALTGVSGAVVLPAAGYPVPIAAGVGLALGAVAILLWRGGLRGGFPSEESEHLRAFLDRALSTQ